MKPVFASSAGLRWQSVFFVAAFVAMGVFNEPILSAASDSSSAARAIICTVKYDMLVQWNKIAAAPDPHADEAM
jgi:hypothetical protein